MVVTGFLMRIFEDRYGWQPIDNAPLDKIDNAPLDKDVSFIATDGRGSEPHRLPYPCRHTTAGWGSLQTVVPTKWKPYFSDQKRK
jgi:hypothetical protein